MNTVEWAVKALKQLRKLPKQDAVRIYEKVQYLRDFPHCDGADIKTLQNHEYPYRLRIGRYRVFFDFSAAIRVIHIEEVKKRDERTY